MRVWSLHPRYLDRQGLTACWRETLLAQAVLAGRTKGYLNHSQLVRFRAHPDPLLAVGVYLDAVAEQATERGYKFDATKVIQRPEPGVVVPRIPVTQGQVRYEWTHLMTKLALRSPDQHAMLLRAYPTPDDVALHPLFTEVPGEIESWERP
ncbi:pyrimidine dimer DNA glycosylase /DNA-(apurinic or apyrimidinic site) lyase [Flavimobilis marinus]|uniref:Pyrimidine dimer DNA glycosylase /DNA-(Apurinic or apyrimidinic site) lyase n=1 Tax=Flavimobilis marinus TaxID=285351 RepID=A0A1I2CA44_9MICO|nr:pyrimidine dimer DNA glycosylase/endonuclease V [Flavimobilis marinus]GHG48119.1 pyrimidine dimer DNA glycosylase /DNA-(apurinic or apyrimidinic site) lyase [Flavimobilis marinus]SFE65124.1 hypothetical protein SAMN04488035_0024 [Flavimobilis marinus]